MNKDRIIIHLLIAGALLCRGEHLFVGVMECDSYRNLELSVAAFAGVTRIPELNQMLKKRGRQLTALPAMKGFEPDRRVRIIETVDPDQPLSEINPANIAIFTIRDGGKAIKEMLASSYKKQTYWRSHINIYGQPRSTNVIPEVALMQAGEHILTSRNRRALLWASQNKKLLNAAPLKQSGTLKLLLNPQRLAAVLNARGDARVLKLFKPVEILQELEICTAEVTIDTQSLTITARAKALSGSPLATLVKNMKVSNAKQRDITPPNSLLQSLSYCENPDIWNRFAINLQNYVVPALNEINHKELFTGKRIQYLMPTPERQGLVFVQSDAVKNKDSTRAMIKTLESYTPPDARIKLEKELAETADKRSRYKLVLKEHAQKSGEASVYHTIASLFLRHAWLEMQLVDDNLISVIGPKNSINEVIKNLSAPKKEISVLTEISARNEDLKREVISGAKVQISGILRQTASMIPNITKEQLRILSRPGYGITFGLDKSAGAELKTSLQISADEITALNHIRNNIRDLMENVLVSMLMEHIEKTQMPSQEDKPR